MIPQLRGLVNRWRERRFILLGVNRDSRERALERMKDMGGSWRNVLDGGPEGPVSRRWHISYEPAIFIVDSTGTLRYRDLRGEKLELAVSELLSEIAD